MSGDRRVRRRQLFDLAAEQGGYFTAAQAREVGYSYQSQAHHVRVENWLRIDRGVFRLADWVPDRHDHLARWSLWARGRGVVSHETALAVYGVGELESARIHLTVPPGFRMNSSALILHHRELPPDDVLERPGFRVTTPLRSLVDAAATADDEDQLERAVVDALDRGLVTRRQLRGRAEAVDTRAALYLERAMQRPAA